MSKAHAFLSASSAHRWIACPPSAKLQEQYTDHGSEFAAQGTDAHALGESKCLKALGRTTEVNKNLRYFDEEMDDCTDQYAAFIMEQLAILQQDCKDPLVLIEQRVDFSRWVPDAFGTADAILVGNGQLTICDLKYGTGVEVNAEHNPQMCCYALGCLELVDDLYNIQEITMIIFQPRREHISQWTITKTDLLHWADDTLVPAAKLAAAGKGTFCSGEHCRFCKAKHECRARAEAQMNLMRYEFDLPPILSDEEISEILTKLDPLISWAEDLKAYALEAAVRGKRWQGFKLVEGRSNRRYTDEEAVVKKVISAGKDPYKRELLGITAMTKLLGRKKFDELLSELVEKPVGKATLVQDSDPRPEMDITTIHDFDD